MTLAIWLGIAVVGCSDNSVNDAASSPGAADLAQVPSAQRWALEDGIVSVDEYRRGFDDFVNCAANQGAIVEQSAVDEQTGKIDYRFLADDGTTAIVDSCYDEFFGEIDVAFQSTDPNLLAASRSEDEAEWQIAYSCLVANGEDYPAAYDSGNPAAIEGLHRYRELRDQGLC